MDSRYILFLTRAARGFVYGVFSVVTVIFLVDDGMSPILAGIVVTASIVLGSLLTFYITTHYGLGYSKSFLLLFSLLLVIGVIGVYLLPGALLKALFVIIGSLGVNPSDNTLFSSFEQPIISKIKMDQNARNRLFSVYSFSGYVASSLGAISLHLGLPASIRLSIVFSAITLIGYLFIPKIEGKLKIQSSPVSKRSKIIARDVSVLFSIDAIGGGFVLQSLMAYWFKVRYNFSLGTLGAVFTVVDIIMAVSVLITPLIAYRIGLINTMVFTHLPSNVFLILIPVVPNLYASLLFLFLRQSLSQMDVPTRQSYLNSVVEGEDRSYVVGVSNATRSVANGATPYISTYLISVGAGSASFIGGGVIKIAYDLLIYFRFRKEREQYS
ncbi:MAG: hypothetical protein ACP5UO_02095 [Thermoplasmata archaeon]